ncbi:protein BatD [Candidatus Poribacteria bacterium]|nr:protein BatD [Candidatus Poribacteria bacterium]
MLKNKIYIILIIFIGMVFFQSRSAYADNISFDVSLDKDQAAVGEEVNLTVIVSGRARSLPDPRIPALKEFTYYTAGRSQSISIINGEISSSTTFNYILIPKKEGTYTIGPLTLSFNNRTYSSQALHIVVHSPKSGASTYDNKQVVDDNVPEESKNQRENPPKEIFVETRVNRTDPYINEQVTLVFAFYQAVNLAETPEYVPASTTGFWVEELPPQKQFYKMMAGKRYLVTEIYNAIFPTASGEYIIGPAEIKCIPENVYQDPFSFFYGGGRSKPIKLSTKPIKMKVKSLPDPNDKQTDFKGAIGSYSLEATLDKTATRENEPVTLKIIIRGNGNIKTVPDIDLSPDMEQYFKKYKSNSSLNITKKNYNVQGEKVLEYILVPIKTGEVTIPPIKLTYFNPEAGKYYTPQTPAFKLTVSPGVGGYAAEEQNKDSNLNLLSTAKEDIKMLGKDIRYLKLCVQINQEEAEYVYSNPVFISLQILPLLLLGGIVGYRKYSDELEKNVPFARAKKAQKLAQTRLMQADKYLKDNSVKEFYAELTKSIQSYIGDKLNMPSASVNQQLIKDELFNRGINNSVINELLDCMDKFDMARFAPGKYGHEEMKDMLEKVKNIIISIEKQLG